MADKKIIDLTALSTQATTDLYETSANGTGSFKETRAQILSYTAANIASAPYAVGDLIYANTTATLGKIADIAVNNVLLSGGVGTAPSYGKVSYAAMQTEGASTLLGNPTGSTGAVSEITLGSGLGFSGTTLVAINAPILQQRWVNAAVGSDSTGTGDINNPWATYAHALSVAAPLATVTNQYVLKMIGNFNEALNLYPFVHIDQEFSGTFTIVGNLATDSSFNITANAVCNISNYSLTSSSPIVIIISTANSQVINFFNGSFGAIPNLAFEGASGAEILYIQDATTNANFPSGVEVVNGSLVLENVVVVGTADTSPTSTFNSNLSITNSFIGGIIFVDSTGSAGGVGVLTVECSIINGWQLSGTLSSATIDSTSYNSAPILFGGALISQVSITGLTDGVCKAHLAPQIIRQSVLQII